MNKLPPQPTGRLRLLKEGKYEKLPSRGRLIVKISQINEDPKNERKTFRNMDGLIASMKAMGVIEPITVLPVGAGAFQIITGHRRFRAAKEAGLEQIEILIRDPEDEHARRIKSIASNVQREDVGPVEMAEALQSLLEEDDTTSQRKLAEVIGKKETWISSILRILTLPAELQKKLSSTKVSVGYDSVADIARVKDKVAQERLVGEVLKGATQREIREKIDELKGKKKATVSETPKPKRVYSTDQDITIIAQSKNETITRERVIAALEQALQQEREESAPRLAAVS